MGVDRGAPPAVKIPSLRGDFFGWCRRSESETPERL